MGKTVFESDVVVVGSGIAGAMAAYQAAKKGRAVSVIEKGIKLTPALVESVFKSESFIGNKDVPSTRIDFSGKEKRSRPLPSVVGGLARFYSGVSLRMREKEFDRWPFPYKDIEPYYMQAERLIKVSGIQGADPYEPKRSGPYPLALPKMSRYSQRLSEGALKMDLKPFQHPFAIDFEANCVRCNHCNQVPCSYGAKWDPDTFISEQAGLPIKVHSDTEAVKIRYSKNGPDRQIVSIEAVSSPSGGAVEFRAKQFVLAGGAILTPKLMLASGMKDWSPLVGNNLMTHCLGLVVGFFPFRISEEGEFHKWWSVSDHYFDELGNVRGLIQQDHLTARRKVFAHVPSLLHPLISRFYYNTCQILVIAEDDPDVANRIELSGGRFLLHQRFSKKDEERRSFLASVSKRIMRNAGALLTFAFKGRSVYHACGTCKAGDSPGSSVVDRNGLVWGTKNLYVADASFFPTSSGVNPSLTIAANALRIADLIP